MSEHIIEAPGLREWFEKAPEVGNPDALLLALKMRVKISIDNEVFGKLLPNPYSSSKLFSASHLSTISNCLKVVSYFFVNKWRLKTFFLILCCIIAFRNPLSVSPEFITYGLLYLTFYYPMLF